MSQERASRVPESVIIIGTMVVLTIIQAAFGRAIAFGFGAGAFSATMFALWVAGGKK